MTDEDIMKLLVDYKKLILCVVHTYIHMHIRAHPYMHIHIHAYI